jgi:hypothetical protein
LALASFKRRPRLAPIQIIVIVNYIINKKCTFEAGLCLPENNF